VYHEAQKIDPWHGGSYPGADFYYEGTSVLAGLKVMKNLGFFKSYRWAFDLNDLVMGVGYNGPAVIGTFWYEGMLHPDKEGWVRPVGEALGGHATLVYSVNVKHEYFTIRNSWGTGWGKGGDCYISYPDMETLLKNQGEAVFALRRTVKV
jgi:hypothetical protein